MPRLFDPERKTKEKSQSSIFTSLFSSKRESVDRDNLFEESGYSKSRSNQIAQQLTVQDNINNVTSKYIIHNLCSTSYAA